MLLQEITSSFLSHSSDASNEPEFLKKYVYHNTNKTMSSSKIVNKNTSVDVLTHDVIGKPLHLFFRKTDNDGFQDSIPYVFMAVYEYFMED
jgi:hypothetical protein